MFQQLFSSSYYYRRFCYGSLAFILTISLSLVNVRPSYSVSWLELMIRGIQIVQISKIDDSQEVERGKAINQKLISSDRTKIYRDRAINNYINQIGQRLAKMSQRLDLPYAFQVVVKILQQQIESRTANVGDGLYRQAYQNQIRSLK